MSLRSLKLLVIEDHPFQRNMVCQQLTGLGVSTVHSAKHGNEALRLLRDASVRIDIVVTDVAMPDMDGIELLSHLGACRPGIGLVFLSASAANLNAAATIARVRGFRVLGAAIKPTSAAELEALILGRVESDRTSSAGQ